jgi:MFS family permease
LVAVLPTLAVAFTSIAAGVYGERIGRRRLLILATAVFAISALLPIWLNSFMLILASRIVAGMAIGVMITSAVALTADYYSGAALQRWLQAQGGAGAIAGVVVSLASGALGEISWRYAFFPLFVGIPLLLGLVVVPAPKVAGAAASAEDEPALASDADGPAPWNVWIGVFALAVVGTAIIFPPAYELGAMVVEKSLGASSITGLGVAVLAGGAVLGAFSVGWLRVPPPAKAALAITFAGIGTIIMAQATTLIPLLAGSAVVGVSQGMLGPVLSIWLLEQTPARLRGRIVGVLQTASFLTVFAAPLIARQIAVGLGASSAAMRVYTIIDLVVIVIIGLFLVRRRASPVVAPAE